MLTDYERERAARVELESGERLLWVGGPDPKRMFISSLGMWILGIPITAISLEWTWTAAGLNRGHAQDFDLVFVVGGVPFILIGIAVLCAPYGAARNAKQTVYAITDKRVLIIEGGNTRRVESYTAQDIGILKRKERADGSGDLAFAQATLESSESIRIVDIEFVAIPQVRSVEAILRNTFKKEQVW